MLKTPSIKSGKNLGLFIIFSICLFIATPATAAVVEPSNKANIPSTSNPSLGVVGQTNQYNSENTSASKSTVAAASSSNPAGCNTSADNPHASGHVNGTINAVVRQDCPRVVQQNSTEARLWEKRWWGYDIIAGPVRSSATTSSSSAINVAAKCRTNSIRVTGYGHYVYNGKSTTSYQVMNTKNVSC